MSVRLSLALDAGLDLSDTGRVLLLHPPGDADLSVLDPGRVLAVQPFRPDFETLERRGFDVAAEVPDGSVFSAVIVFLPRAKDLARALLAQAVTVTEGTVVVDGAKTDGIDSILKALRGRVTLAGSLSKAHGKIAWFVPGAGDWSDWQESWREVGDFRTRPGVFSADGVDPASALLAAHLPERLGRHVVDLGAGWGYLSAQLLRDPGLQRLDLVEADARALACARAVITDPRAAFHWADARTWRPDAAADAVVTNPPFHTGRAADPALGQAFVQSAAAMLVPSGKLYVVANRQLPYETTLAHAFGHVEEIGGDGRFKILRAERPSRRGR